jgi:hypothetical protein
VLDNPLIFREPKLLLDKPQAPYRTSLKVFILFFNLKLFKKRSEIIKIITQKKEKNVKIDQTNTQPKLAQINDILESLKEKKTVSEMNLSEALKKIDDKSQYEKAKKLLEKVTTIYDYNLVCLFKLIIIKILLLKAQKKYEEVKRESLKTLGSAKI